MLIELPENRTAWLIGDPHMGREFRTGVPMHRRGEREAMQRKQLMLELDQDVDVNVTVGDLFDSPFVSYADLAWVISAYKAAAANRPRTTFVVIPGNHCLSRQPDAVGAFHLFAEAMAGAGVEVCWTPTNVRGISVIPWSWSMTALEQLAKYPSVLPVVVGHWDLESFGGDESHLCPAQALVERGAQRIYTGHWHLPGEYEVDGITVTCTGSMMPYSHAEDPTGELYVTLTLSEVCMQSSDALRDKCVRLILGPGETPPEDLDCLALTVKREGEPDNESDDKTLEIDGFDWQATIDAELDGLDPKVDKFIRDRLRI